MYKTIKKHKSVLEMYADAKIEEGIMTQQEFEVNKQMGKVKKGQVGWRGVGGMNRGRWDEQGQVGWRGAGGVKRDRCGGGGSNRDMKMS